MTDKKVRAKNNRKNNILIVFIVFFFVFLLITYEPFGVSACSWPRKIEGDVLLLLRPKTIKSNERQKSYKKKTKWKKKLTGFFFFFFFLITPKPFGVSNRSLQGRWLCTLATFCSKESWNRLKNKKVISKKTKKNSLFCLFFCFFGLFFPYNFRTLWSFCVFLASKSRWRRWWFFETKNKEIEWKTKKL